MKIKRTNRITALVLAIVMLSSMLSMVAYAEPEGEEPREAIVFGETDFENVVRNQVNKAGEGEDPVMVDGTSIDGASAGLASVHTYVDIGEDEDHGKYAIVPFRGTAFDTKTNGSGNFDKTFTLQHPEVSYANTQGVVFELDLYVQHVPTGIEGEKDPTVEFQLRSINHDTTFDGKTSTSFITFGQLNLRTGEFDMISATKMGVKGVKSGEWNKLRFELDLVNGTYDIFVNGQKYAVYGRIGGGSTQLKNIVIPASTLLIAKTNKCVGAYVDNDAVASTAMSYVGVDNIKFYENIDFIPPETEPVVPYSIFNDSFQSKTVGMKPQMYGYKAGITAVIAEDPLNPSNRVLKTELAAVSGKDQDYFLWHSSNYGGVWVEVNSDYNPDDPTAAPKYTFDEDGYLVAKTSFGTVKGKVWGDDPNETSAKTESFASYVINDTQLPAQQSNRAGSWYLITGAMRDAIMGGSNVATTLGPSHPAIKADDYKQVVLNVDYYFSEDAVGKFEVQMNGFVRTKATETTPSVKSDRMWIDTVTVDAKAGSEYLTISGNTSNYIMVCGSAPTVKKGEWYTMSVVLDMSNGWMDIYFNGSYAFTTKPRSSYKIGGVDVNEKDFEFDSIDANTLSVGKIQRNVYSPSEFSGYFMVDNINFSTGEVLLGEQYEKNFVQNFNDLTADPETGVVDFSKTQFATNIPGSVVLANESEAHSSVLKFGIGEALDEAEANTLVLWGTSASIGDKVHLIAKEYEDGAVLLQSALAEGEEAPEEMPADRVITPKRGKYTVNGTSGYVIGTYLEYVNYWGKLADGTPAKSVDKQWTFHNPGISYALKDRVAIDVELMIPEGASGVVQSQFTKGAGSKDGGKANFTFLKVYAIDLATGNINFGEFVDDENKVGTLEIGKWNNLSLAINMKTGAVELYINNFFVAEGNLGYTDVAFYENTWILAKVARKQTVPFAGYLMIDDARFFTVTNQLITVDSKLENVTGAFFNGVAIPDGTKVFITEDVDYVEETFDTSDYLDVIDVGFGDDFLVSVRTNAPIGLRFTSYVDEDLLSELLAEHPGTVTYGTVILPSSSIATVENLTRPELDRRGISYLDVRTNEFFKNDYLENELEVDVYGIFAGSIIGLKEENLMRDFSAVGYVEIALESGGSIVLYTERMDANLAKLAQNYLDEWDGIPDDIKVILDAFAIGRYPAGHVKDY